MLFNRINIFMGTYILPILLLIVIIMVVGLNFVLLGIQDEPMFTAVAVLIDFAFILSTSFLVTESAKFTGSSESAVRIRREETSQNDEAMLHTLDTCTPLLTNIGGFFNIEMSTLFEIYATILDFTINLLLMDEGDDLASAFA